MDPGSVGFNTGEPQIQLYFLLGLVYAVVTPVLLPFILVFFVLAYVVFRHQEAMMKDTLERAREPNLSLKAHLQNAYVHPVFKNDEDDEDYDDIYDGKLDASVLVPTKRQS